MSQLKMLNRQVKSKTGIELPKRQVKLLQEIMNRQAAMEIRNNIRIAERARAAERSGDLNPARGGYDIWRFR
jgi:hypothetical protein